MTRAVTRSPEETIALGREFALRLAPGAIVALHGTLGSGKTCFVQGACLGLGALGNISSPTFTIINEYPARIMFIIFNLLFQKIFRFSDAQAGFVVPPDRDMNLVAYRFRDLLNTIGSNTAQRHFLIAHLQQLRD